MLELSNTRNGEQPVLVRVGCGAASAAGRDATFFEFLNIPRDAARHFPDFTQRGGAAGDRRAPEAGRRAASGAARHFRVFCLTGAAPRPTLVQFSCSARSQIDG